MILDAGERCFLQGRCADLAADYARLAGGLPARLVHGDPQHRNTLWDGDRVVLADWDSAAVGPVEWDAVTVEVHCRRFGHPAGEAVPTLKGGSTIGIPSQPAIWVPGRPPGAAIGTPGIADAERLQGFPSGWTVPAEEVARPSIRWKLVGNAVTVGVSAWLGRRLVDPGDVDPPGGPALSAGHRWPGAAWGRRGARRAADVSMWPERQPYRHLLDLVDPAGIRPLSRRAVEGFHGRMERSTLRFDERFRLAVKEHLVAARQAAEAGDGDRPASATPACDWTWRTR